MNTNHSVVFILLLVLFGTACKQNYVTEEPASQPTKKRVVVKKLEESTTAVPIVASGVLASETEANLSFKIGGIIKRLSAEKGQSVRQGQVLAQLDLAEINAQVTQAQNGFDKAQRDLDRVESLYQDTVATLEQKQDATTALELARASLNVAQFNRRYASIVVPFDGKILDKRAERGELVTPGQPIYSVGSAGTTGSQVINIGIADRQIVKLKATDTAQVRFDAFPNRQYAASITEISEEANPFTGTFDVELTLTGYFPELKNGFVGYVSVFPTNVPKHYKIPMTALIEGKERTANVFTTQDKVTVRKKVLRVDEIHSDFFTVNALQLSPDEWLVMEGSAYLNDQDTIQIIN